jgi:synaptosomal-associated protein 47
MPAEENLKEGVSSTCEPFGKEGVVITVPAIISERAESHSKLGKLTVLVSALEIYDSCSLLLHRFEKEDVDDIKVHSPYEVSIRQRFIGKPDVAYQLISAKMPEVIPILEVQFSSKIELLEDALVLRNKVFASSAERHAGEWPAGQCVCSLPKLEPHSACCDSCSAGPSISSCWLQLAGSHRLEQPFQTANLHLPLTDN